ncbi:hypothetical protein BV22DRAFT_1135695 [Leucogyrophana mollusca]|uniref:Uncharacterized protein n=1 Tax=Leucogyrophana mollusca TaxID=85980 RepID=A0ACB8AUS5_9AGAM|nr:hypothetical protein BV22DRAFT_1135695 [Leucogyrophana mollusca]
MVVFACGGSCPRDKFLDSRSLNKHRSVCLIFQRHQVNSTRKRQELAEKRKALKDTRKALPAQGLGSRQRPTHEQRVRPASDIPDQRSIPSQSSLPGPSGTGVSHVDSAAIVDPSLYVNDSMDVDECSDNRRWDNGEPPIVIPQPISQRPMATDSERIRPRRNIRLPARYRDELPVPMAPVTRPPPQSQSAASIVRRVILHVRDTIRTQTHLCEPKTYLIRLENAPNQLR